MFSSLVPTALLVIYALLTGSPDAQTILDTAREKQAKRWATVENYTVTIAVQDAGGLQTPVYYEKIEVDGQPTFRMVPPAEYTGRICERAGFPPLTPEEMEEMGLGLDMMGDAVAVGGGDMPPMDVRGMTGQMSAFMRAGAAYDPDDGKADAKDAMADMAEFARRARVRGTEQVASSYENAGQMRDAYLLVAEGLSDIDLSPPEGGAEYTLQKASLWIDTEHYVPLRLLMELEVEADGRKMPMTIEKLDQDYRQVGPLYESQRQVYRLSGLMSGMSEKERKEMEKAKKQMEEAKKKLAEMPDDQKEMVMKMMGGQMEKLEKMMEGDAVESVTSVVSIAVNEGPPAPYGLGDLTVGGPAAATYPGALTMAGDDGRAQLSIAARLPGTAEAIFGLEGAGPFPESGEVSITGASGSVELEGGVRVVIEKGTGTITVTERTDTRIAGTFTALLTGTPSTETPTKTVQFSASGRFDSGAPVGPFRAPRGSPFPADLFGGQ